MSHLHLPDRVWERLPNGLWRSRGLDPARGERLDAMDHERRRRAMLLQWWEDVENPPTDRKPVRLTDIDLPN